MLLIAMSDSTVGWTAFATGRPLVMGILNVTPDSFSDGGQTASTESAVAQGHAMLAAGADIIDIGGESTRPNATPVSPDTEIARVLPVITALAAVGATVSRRYPKRCDHGGSTRSRGDHH